MLGIFSFTWCLILDNRKQSERDAGLHRFNVILLATQQNLLLQVLLHVNIFIWRCLKILCV